MGNTHGNFGQGTKHSELGRHDDKRKKKDLRRQPPGPPIGMNKHKCKNHKFSQQSKLPVVMPLARCRLRLQKLERIKDYLLLEEEVLLLRHIVHN